MGLGCRLSGQAQSRDVERNGGVHLVLDLVTRAAGGDAAGQIRRERGKAGFSVFDEDEITANLSSAGLRMQFCVTGGLSDQTRQECSRGTKGTPWIWHEVDGEVTLISVWQSEPTCARPELDANHSIPVCITVVRGANCGSSTIYCRYLITATRVADLVFASARAFPYADDGSENLYPVTIESEPMKITASPPCFFAAAMRSESLDIPATKDITLLLL